MNARPRFDDGRLLSRERCEALARRIEGFARGGGATRVMINSWWTGELRWARNRVSLASDRRETMVWVAREIDGAHGGAATNQLDDASLEAAVRAAERSAHFKPRRPDAPAEPPPRFDYPRSAIWSDATYQLTAEERGRVARTLVESAEATGMYSAGYIEVLARAVAYLTDDDLLFYAPCTQARCAMTVRDPKGTGSGWAGKSSYDWAKIDGPALAARALDKCLRSRNPVALEPGRYTVILEPQAVADLVGVLIEHGLLRYDAERGAGPFTAGFDRELALFRSKLGMQVVDPRITIDHDPMHPDLGVLPFTGDGEPIQPVTWVDRGVLTTLAYERSPYALARLNQNDGRMGRLAFRMSGGETSIEAMIESTKRGLLVTRFSDIRVLDENSLLSTGLTRDGLWLIENGQIAKPVKNFRFTDSPLFVLNNVDALGPAEPVFRPALQEDTEPLTPAIVPPLKARDFSFTSLVDAI